MGGYQHYVTLRMSPLDGADETMDMMLAFTDCKGPTIIGPPNYEIERTRRQDINRRRATRFWGLRFECALRFAIIDMDDSLLLSKVVKRGLDTDQWTLYLSIDGGYNEHEVELDDWEGPLPLNGNTNAGAEWVLEFVARNLIDEVPDVRPDLDPPSADASIPASPVAFTASVPLVPALPTASRDYAGRLLRWGSGTEEQVWVCLVDAGGDYQWIEWGTGGSA